jgi:uncharacterized protein GlcG (DUF336 family)
MERCGAAESRRALNKGKKRMSRKITCLAAAAVAFVIAAPAGAQQLLPRRDLSLGVARLIADTALRMCEQQGNRVSIHVVDRYGQTIVSYMSDGAAPHTYENARRKAYTAMTFRRPSREFGERMAMNDATAELQLMLPSMSGQQGGLPIRVGNDVIGGVGMSGSAGGADEPCVQAGLNAAANALR